MSMWAVAALYASLRIFICCPLYYDHITLTSVTRIPTEALGNGTVSYDHQANKMFPIDQALTMLGMFPTTISKYSTN